MSKSKTILVGIDVAARTLEVCIRTSKGTRSLEVSNDAVGHASLVATLSRYTSPVMVAVEATGVYHIEVAWALHLAPGIRVTVLNPRVFANFAKAVDQRGKSDRADAAVLVEFLERMPFADWLPPSENLMALRVVTRRIAQLGREITRERNRLHALERLVNVPGAVTNDVEDNIRRIQARVAELETAGLAILRQEQELAELYDIATSMPGVGPRTGMTFLSELAVMPADMTARQWVAHAGIDPLVRQSGTSLNTTAHISRRGNRHLRAALYMPAVSAIKCAPCVQAYAARLAEKRKPTNVIRVAVMRKILHAVHGMWRTKTTFDPTRFSPAAPNLGTEVTPSN